MRRAWALAVLLLACGKERAQRVSYEGFLAPTDAAGFHPVEPLPGCVPGEVRVLPTSPAGSLESVASLAQFTGQISADDRHVYWVEGQRIRRAARGALPWEWKVTDVLRSSEPIVDFAVTNEHVYWTTAEIDGHTALRGLEKKTANVLEPRYGGRDAPRTPLLERGAMSKLAARDGSIFWLSEKEGLREILDREGLRTLSHAEVTAAVARSAVITADATNVYAALPDGIARVSRRDPAQRAPLVRGANAVAAASDGTFLYWLERGDEGVPPKECHRRCSSGSRYEMVREKKPYYPKGKLRRVPVSGGKATDVASDLVDVETLMAQPETGVVWIGTAGGLVRVDGRAEHPTALAVVANAQAHGNIVPFGGALALAAEAPTERIALFSVP